MKTILTPHAGYVILNAPPEKEAVTASGLYVPESATENSNMLIATVYASGGSKEEIYEFIGDGDTVATFKNKAMRFSHGENEYFLVRFEDILFTVSQEDS